VKERFSTGREIAKRVKFGMPRSSEIVTLGRAPVSIETVISASRGEMKAVFAAVIELFDGSKVSF
jgi:hypothetical protein